MKHKLVYVSLLLISMVSCQEDKGRPLIEEERMANIIADYYVEQATISQFNLPHSNDRFLYYSELMEKYGCTESDFDSSLVWYSRNLDVFEKVYERAEVILEARKDSLTRLMAIPVNTENSLATDSVEQTPVQP